MSKVSVQDYLRQVDCTYKGENYSVRDNGAVLRHARSDKRPRPSDNEWTFGKADIHNGYMHISNERIHRIVATAFHGNPPTPKHVVDHIDTNRRNNRPENLQWLTRLENALRNPITVKRIKLICGSIEAFLQNPSLLHHHMLSRNLQWMRTVSVEEADACLERMHLWAKSDKPVSANGSLGEWVYKPLPSNPPSNAVKGVHPMADRVVPLQKRPILPAPSDLIMALTPGASQRNWRTPSEFPCCPQQPQGNPIAAYAANLMAGAIFSRNKFSTHKVLEAVLIDDEQAICVMSESDSMKPWSLAKISVEDGLYLHTSHGTFFSKQGAEKQFCLARGLEWTGDGSIDDYC